MQMQRRWHPWLALLSVLLLGAARDEPREREAVQAYRVPYRMSETLHLIVRAKLDGKGPFNFIVDTGAPAMFVTTSVAKQVGAERGRDGWTTFSEMEIEGGAKLKDVKARAEDIFQIRGMNSLNLPGVRLDGVLGYNVLAKFRMQFDLSKSSMLWTPLDFDPPLPQPLGNGKSAPPELELIGTMMQGFGALLNRGGKTELPAPRGFFGFVMAERDGQVEITSVVPEAPAETAGLKSGDTLVEFAGKPVRSAADVFKLAAQIGVGEQVRLRVQRDQDKVDVTITTQRGF